MSWSSREINVIDERNGAHLGIVAATVASPLNAEVARVALDLWSDDIHEKIGQLNVVKARDQDATISQATFLRDGD